jgi:hypothetical protein
MPRPDSNPVQLSAADQLAILAHEPEVERLGGFENGVGRLFGDPIGRVIGFKHTFAVEGTDKSVTHKERVAYAVPANRELTRAAVLYMHGEVQVLEALDGNEAQFQDNFGPNPDPKYFSGAKTSEDLAAMFVRHYKENKLEVTHSSFDQNDTVSAKALVIFDDAVELADKMYREKQAAAQRTEVSANRTLDRLYKRRRTRNSDDGAPN